ncbi:saccharopine dehydrogenase NADP-binding domain-containing protein [Nocardia otitidiscaviarum]|uniref:saccharopine dehydrogenase NADP-binding domain-containing protein n=1 Tax=Nocardia otitidiscaviarum TaxID=1823 RepID=UPI0004A76DE3|nr:saccharopine dehydrogenase NADP-binding domain-containing protein [Nocardia otitidiscaviarum]MBF6134190.1 saccharopine dehydrogenase NADP-binding domain-containing protein [Nocardia otitidiscaviarum]MBF6484148.1 saccharopine dehydrogenase NADP-binding domain-containing protein [Nocardia otitidiscaviarum]
MTSTNSIAQPTIAVYGATGHTGGYVLAELRRRELTPILVGRDADRLRAAAAAAGIRAADIRVAGVRDHAALVRAFTGADTVISTLPAYVELGEPILAAAIDAGAHYTDTSGEQLFLKSVLDEYGPRAEAAGVTVVSGITDSNLPGDLLAHLTARRVSGPAEIVISHLSRSGGNGSKGSAKTILASRDWFISGGWHYEGGKLRTGPTARHTTMTFPGDSAPTEVAKFAQPPVLTVPRHSEVSYVAGALDIRILAHLSGFTAEALAAMPDEPSSDLRYDLVVDAFGARGERVRGVVSGVDSYRDSALMAAEGGVRLAAGTAKPGALAPAEAFDAEEVLNALAPHGITWRIEGW